MSRPYQYSVQSTTSFTNPVNALTALTTTKEIVIGLSNGNIRLLSITSGSSKLFLNSHSHAIIFLTQLPNYLFLSSSLDQTIKIWDSRSGSSTSSISVANTIGIGYCGTLLTNGLVAIGSSNRSVTLWNTATLAITKTLIGHNNSIYGIAQLKNGILASGK